MQCSLKDGRGKSESSAVINYTFCGGITENLPVDVEVEVLRFKLVDVNELNRQRGLPGRFKISVTKF